MIETIKKTRVIVVRHIMQRVCNDEFDVDTGLKLIKALDEEYEQTVESITRWERACFQITDNRTVLVSG